jgi:hypothetical protein
VTSKPNQGMRQPQMGGIQSQLRLASAAPLCARSGHTQRWRLNTDSKWHCMVCHPPAVERYEVEEVPA